MDRKWYHVVVRLTAKHVEPVVSISWASCFRHMNMGKRNLKTVSKRLFPFFFFFPFFCKKNLTRDRKTEIETRKKKRKHFLFCVFSFGNWEINNRNENITENVFRYLFFAFRILCISCSGRRKLKTEAEKKENIFVSVFPVNRKRFLCRFLRRMVTGKGKINENG